MDLQLLKVKEKKAVHDLDSFLADKVNTDGNPRPLTEEEDKQFDALEKTLANVGTQLRQQKWGDEIKSALAELTGIDHGEGMPVHFRRGPSLGQQFLSHKEMKGWLEAKGFRQNFWRSPTIELETKALLSEAADSGGGLVVPTYAPGGIRPLPLPPPRLAELLAKGTTASNAVVAMRETAFTNQAAATAEGAVKPESSLTFEATSEPVRKIAHFLPATEEILDDEPTLKSYIDARLIAGVRVALDRELLSGSGVAPHLLGLLNRPNLAPTVAQGTMTAVDAIAVQIGALMAANEDLYPPDAIIVNPLDWTGMVLGKSTDKQYIGASPFETPTTRTLWGLPVVPISGMPQGQALVGAFATAAQLFVRGQVQVVVSNSHQDWFVKDLVAIRAEIRAAFHVYRSQAFGLIAGITAAAATE